MTDIPYVQIIIAALVVVLYAVLKIRRQQNKDKILAAIQAGAKVIDVRSPGEFATGHYQGAVNIPVDKVAGKIKAIGSPDTPVVVYCASGARSAAAAGTLKSAGFTRVFNAGPLSAMPRT